MPQLFFFLSFSPSASSSPSSLISLSHSLICVCGCVGGEFSENINKHTKF